MSSQLERGLPRLSGPMLPGTASGLTVFEWATVLRGQITLLRRRCEHGLPVELASLANTEHLARELETAAAAVR
jgi:hypothetical protein